MCPHFASSSANSMSDSTSTLLPLGVSKRRETDREEEAPRVEKQLHTIFKKTKLFFNLELASPVRV